MKNVFVHFVGDGKEPKNVDYQFAEIPRVAEFVSLTDSDVNQWFEVVAVIHLAMSEDYKYDKDNPNEFAVEVWVKNPVEPNEVVEKFLR